MTLPRDYSSYRTTGVQFHHYCTAASRTPQRTLPNRPSQGHNPIVHLPLLTGLQSYFPRTLPFVHPNGSVGHSVHASAAPVWAYLVNVIAPETFHPTSKSQTFVVKTSPPHDAILSVLSFRGSKRYSASATSCLLGSKHVYSRWRRPAIRFSVDSLDCHC